MVDCQSVGASNSSDLSRRDIICRTAALGAALGTAGLAAKKAVAADIKPGKPERKPIYKSLKFGMIKEKLSILDKFKLVQDLGYDGVELDSPGGQNKKECLEASQKTGLPIHGVVDSKHWSVRATEADDGHVAHSGQR